MKTKMMRLALAGLVCASTLCPAVADEGMWLLGHMDAKTMQVCRDLGLQLTDDELYGEDGMSLKDCVVDFGDFCSGVIVSRDGLVFTNHHCGYSAIQALSTPEDNILDNGFVARTREEERPAKGLYVKVWLRSEDVTDQVTQALRAKDAKPLGTILNDISAEAQRAQTEKSILTEVKSFYGGSRFLLNYYRLYSDIRLVFTVPQTLGKFGGDTDNWMWPRQTADFSVFRIYTDPDGNPAEYDAQNVPLHPKRWARMALDGYQQGSYCMTIGYPGSTSRYLSSYGIDERVHANNIPVFNVRGVKQEVWTRWMRSDTKIGIQYATKYAHSSNYWKNSQGMNEAIERLGIIDQKEQRQQDLLQSDLTTAAEKKTLKHLLGDLRKSYKARREAYTTNTYFREVFDRGIELVNMARQAQRWAAAKDSAMRADMEQAMQALYKDYDPRVDEEVMAALLRYYATQVPAKYLPAFYKTIQHDYQGDYTAYAHEVFATTQLATMEQARTLCGMDADVECDPAWVIYRDAQAMRDKYLAPRLTKYASRIKTQEDQLTQIVIAAGDRQGIPHYSDANFTMRMSYGIVSDYTNAGIHNAYYTAMPSLIDKVEHGAANPDYAMPLEVLRLLKSGDYGRYADPTTGEMQLCFLTTNDITGGNSGSPMFDGKGQLLGLAFDGNWDALSSDISFDASLQRCIGVDIRFVLWLMDYWGHAEHLTREVLAE